MLKGDFFMKVELPTRKHPRLEHYDYSAAGAYYVTICTQNRRCVLSRIVSLASNEENVAKGGQATVEPRVEYSRYGVIAEQQLFLLEKRYPYLSVDRYVIMPNHIHAILILDAQTAGASPRPTMTDIICAYKSLTTRECKKNGFTEKLFQTSFFEHIIRCREDYENTVNYIQKNPIGWHLDDLYAE